MEEAELINGLSNEISTIIFSFLPVISMMKLREVCKVWHFELERQIQQYFSTLKPDSSFHLTHLHKSIETSSHRSETLNLFRSYLTSPSDEENQSNLINLLPKLKEEELLNLALVYTIHFNSPMIFREIIYNIESFNLDHKVSLPNYEDSFYLTPLSIALYHSRDEMIKIICRKIRSPDSEISLYYSDALDNFRGCNREGENTKWSVVPLIFIPFRKKDINSISFLAKEFYRNFIDKWLIEIDSSDRTLFEYLGKEWIEGRVLLLKLFGKEEKLFEGEKNQRRILLARKNFLCERNIGIKIIISFDFNWAVRKKEREDLDRISISVPDLDCDLIDPNLSDQIPNNNINDDKMEIEENNNANLGNENNRLEVWVKEEDEIRQLSKHVNSELGIPISKQLFSFHGENLDLKSRLIDRNITNGSIVKLKISEGEFFQIFIKNLSGKTFTIWVFASDLVIDLKEKIFHRTEMSVKMQRLIFGAKPLADCFSLSDYNIKKDSTIFLVARLRGGLIAV